MNKHVHQYLYDPVNVLTQDTFTELCEELYGCACESRHDKYCRMETRIFTRKRFPVPHEEVLVF